jgi:GLPGLI family protein
MVFYLANAQRVLSEARLEYTIAVTDHGKDASKISDAFKNAIQVVWLRANMARTDFTSPQRLQSTIFNSTTGEATILREAGEEKFMWLLDSTQWKKVNNRYAQSSFSGTEETREISGYLCKKGAITLSDSTIVTVFYTPQLQPLARGNEPMFELLPGFPVMYEWNIGSSMVTYTLSTIQNIPVGAARFESPKEGYKIVKAPIKEPL